MKYLLPIGIGMATTILASTLSDLLPSQSPKPAQISSTQRAKPFEEWCNQKNSIAPEAKKTIDLLIKEVDDKDCKTASKKLLALTSLDLYHNDISDIEPLASLKNLTSLDLIGNQIVDISPLANLPNLTYLALAKNQIETIRPLANLPNLTYLSLNQNKIKNIEPLHLLQKLTDLQVQDNPIINKTCPIERYACHFSSEK